MRSLLVLSALILIGSAAWGFDPDMCMRAAIDRSDALLIEGKCPEIVRTTPAQLQRRFAEMVKVGDDAACMERALSEMGLGYSWDRVASRYQAILRAPNSNFHAVVVYVYVDAKGGFKSFEAEDSFTLP